MGITFSRVCLYGLSSLIALGRDLRLEVFGLFTEGFRMDERSLEAMHSLR